MHIEKTIHGSGLTMVLHSLRDDRVMGLEQVSRDIVALHRFSTHIFIAGTGFIAQTITFTHRAGSRSWIAVSTRNLSKSSAGTIMANLTVCPDLRFANGLRSDTYALSCPADIGPVLGAQPGSEAWTKNRDHDAWRLMTKYFVERYKGFTRSNPEVSLITLSRGHLLSFRPVTGSRGVAALPNTYQRSGCPE
jgi:hypothetical protein